MHHQIRGEIAQTALLTFDAGETAWASNGSLMSYSPNLSWDLKVPGGLGGAFRRSLSGEGLSLTYLQAQGTGAWGQLAANSPGHITPWDLAGGAVIATSGSFLAAWGPQIDITVTTAKRAGAAFFGGAGLFLQKVSGVGTVLIHGSGDFQELNLRSGEQVQVSSGNLAAFSEHVDYDIVRVGGMRKTLFSGEGLFMTRLTGPGRVLLQSLKPSFGKPGPAG